MEEVKQHTVHAETAREAERVEYDSGIFTAEPTFAKWIPGGYHPSRCLKLRGRRMMYAIMAVAGTAIMFFGYDASVMSQVNTNNDYLSVMGIAGGTDRDAAAVGGIVSIWFAGFAIGALSVGAYADQIGRLKTVEIGCLWGILGAALMASAQNITWMMFARIVSGIGCGHMNTVVPIWTSEVADADMRGAFVAVEFTLALTGSTIAYWMEYGLTQHQSLPLAWRLPLGFQVVFLFTLLAVIHIYPESPRHLAKQGRLDEARAILTQCRLENDPTAIEAEMSRILEALRLEASSTNYGYGAMLFKKDRFHTRRRILLAMGIQVFQKATGIDFIAAYSPLVFQLGGYSKQRAALLAGGNFFPYVASLALAIYLADHFGRRKLMLTGCLSMGIVLIVGGILAHQVQKYQDADPSKRLPYGAGVTAILYIYTFIYGSTWLTTCWVYPTEVFPLATRAKGAALATVAFSIAGGTINEIIPYLVAAVGFWTFIIFALINLIMLIPIYLFYIETANRNLEDMDLLFSSNSVLAWRAEKEYAELREPAAATAYHEERDVKA